MKELAIFIDTKNKVPVYEQIYVFIKNAIIKNEPAVLVNLTTGEEYAIKYDLSQRQKDIILAGGLLNYTKESF